MGYVTVHRGHSLSEMRAYVVPDGRPTTIPGRHRKEPLARSSRRVAGWVLAASAVVGVGSTIGWTISNERHTMESIASATAVDPDVAEWMRSNLPDGTKVLTDAQPAPAGFANSPVGQADQDWHAFNYLLTNPGDPPLDTTAAAVWRSSVPVAIFPTVQVRQILPTLPDQSLRTREADRADRLVAGSALLANDRIAASPQAQTALAAGGLDLRAAATLTALTADMDVSVVDIEPIRAEAAAGMPARSMTIHVADPGRVTIVLSGLTAAFRTDQIIATPDGTFRLHWPLSFAPVPSVN